MADFEKVYSIKFNVGKAKNSLKLLSKVVEKLNKHVEKLAINSTIASKNMKEMFRSSKRAATSFKRSIDKATNSIQEMKRNSVKTGVVTQRTFKSTERQVVRLTTKVKRLNKEQLKGRMKSFGRKASTRATLPALAAAGGALSSSLNFNKQMANVSTLLTGGMKQINAYKKSIQDLSISSGKSTGDLAAGMYEVVSAFEESTDNVDQLGSSINAAIAGKSTTLESVKLLSAVTKGYGDSSKEALDKASDLAFMTVKLGQTTFPELAASIGKVVPSAAALNTSQEELFGTFATLTGVSGNTAEVATQLSSIYTGMLAPSEALTELSKKYEFQSAATMMKTLGFSKTMEILKKETNGEADAIAKLLPRKEAQNALLVLLGGQSEKYKEKLEAMTKATGATDEAFRKQTEGINAQGHKWDQTKQKFIVFAQKVGDKLLPALGTLTDKLAPVFKFLSDMDGTTLTLALGIAGVATAIGPLSLALGTLGKAGGPLALVVTGFIAWSSVVATLRENLEFIKNSKLNPDVVNEDRKYKKEKADEDRARAKKFRQDALDRAGTRIPYAGEEFKEQTLLSGSSTGASTSNTTNNFGGNTNNVSVSGVKNDHQVVQAVKRELKKESKGMKQAASNATR